MKTKRKYLNVEILDGNLHIYASNKKHGAKICTLNEMDNECFITEINCKTKNIHRAIPLKDFI